MTCTSRGSTSPTRQLAELFEVDPDAWLSECVLTEEYFAQFGGAVPAELYAQLQILREGLEAAKA